MEINIFHAITHLLLQLPRFIIEFQVLVHKEFRLQINIILNSRQRYLIGINGAIIATSPLCFKNFYILFWNIVLGLCLDALFQD